jgi:predicted phosphodiesterase
VKRAIISDIHANLEALQAVLAHIDTLNVDQVVCLGDMIGYGPNPAECLDLVMDKCDVTILGNHDQAAIFDPEGFNPIALRAIFWTREQMEQRGDPAQIDRRWDFIGELPRRLDEGEFLYVHGSPRDPTNEYVFPEHIYEQSRIDALMSRFQRYCFQGHTHIPGVFTESYQFLPPEENDFFFNLGEQKIMINVGSVGQPRDGDPRACYVVLDNSERSVQFYRVEYDVEATRQKILGTPELDDMLGNRLVTGR